LKIDRLYFTVEQLAEHWRLPIADIMQLGLTNQLKFITQADWEFPDFEIIHRGEHTPINFEELANIYYATEPLFKKGHCQTSQDAFLIGSNVTITYYPGINRLIIDASEVERFERENLYSSGTLTEPERDILLKQIGLLSLVLAERVNKYKKGSGDPNVYQIANDASEIVETWEFEGKRGTSSSSIRENIARGLKLLITPKN